MAACTCEGIFECTSRCNARSPDATIRAPTQRAPLESAAFSARIAPMAAPCMGKCPSSCAKIPRISSSEYHETYHGNATSCTRCPERVCTSAICGIIGHPSQSANFSGRCPAFLRSCAKSSRTRGDGCSRTFSASSRSHLANSAACKGACRIPTNSKTSIRVRMGYLLVLGAGSHR